MGVQWKSETPTEEGWYWMQYKGKNRTVTCPCFVTCLKDGTNSVRSANNDFWVEGPNHGGKGLKYGGANLDKSILFGPAISLDDYSSEE